MLLSEILLVAVGAIRANKLRAMLTMLGIIIGIAAVITMVALGEGAQQAVESELQDMGAHVLTVRPGQEFMRGFDHGDGARLRADAAEVLVEDPEYVLAVSPEMERDLQVTYDRFNSNTEVVGVWPAFFDIQNHELAVGRLFTRSEERSRRRVAVLGANVGEQLGVEQTAELIGETIRIAGAGADDESEDDATAGEDTADTIGDDILSSSIPFEVVGVLAEKGEQGWSSPDENIYIPLASAQHRVFGTDRLRSIYVQAVDGQSMDAAMAEIDGLVRRANRLRPGEPSNFTIRDYTSLLSTMQETTNTFSFLLAGIAFVSLVVGGIGIMNIMLVSVTERTREIGIRKALGARRRDIMLQFLIEALVLCLAGGAIGLGTGIGGAYAVQRFAAWQTAIAPDAVVLAFGFAAAVGLFFGIWPAKRAAALDPIVALRYE